VLLPSLAGCTKINTGGKNREKTTTTISTTNTHCEK
jgi:hypothetical protein